MNAPIPPYTAITIYRHHHHYHPDILPPSPGCVCVLHAYYLFYSDSRVLLSFVRLVSVVP